MSRNEAIEMNKLKTRIEELESIIKNYENKTYKKDTVSKPTDSGAPITATQDFHCPQLTKLRPDRFEASSWYAKSYHPRLSMDGDLTTQWLIHPSKQPIGQTLDLKFRGKKKIVSISIYNPKEETIRIKTATFTFSDGSKQTVESERMDEWDDLKINPVITDYLILEIVDIYPHSSNRIAIYELKS